MDHSNGTYVALELSDNSKRHVVEFSQSALNLKNPVDPEYLHSTVIYSPIGVCAAEFLKSEITGIATPIRYEIFKTRNDVSCLTVILDFSLASALNSMLTKLGATSRFDHYTPHLTLSYDYTGTINDLPHMKFDLIYDRLVVKPLDINFIPPNSKLHHASSSKKIDS